jgi:hypothetical protein
LGHVMPSYTGLGTSSVKHSSVGSSIASESQQDIRCLTGGMKYALLDSNPGSWLAKEQKSRLRFGGRRLLLLNDEAWRCHPYDSSVTFWKWNDNLIVLFELWRSILKMDIFYCKNWSCDIVIKYSLN